MLKNMQQKNLSEESHRLQFSSVTDLQQKIGKEFFRRLLHKVTGTNKKFLWAERCKDAFKKLKYT